MEFSAVGGFALIAFTLIAIPGPDWAFVLAAGTRDHVVLPAVAGLMVGYAIMTAIVVIGVAPLVAASAGALVVLTLVGSVYLIYLGVRTLRSTTLIEQAGTSAMVTTRSRHYLLRGIGVSALNPKGLLIFLSILPQFTQPATPWPLGLQLATLGGVFILTAAPFYIALGYASDRVLGVRPQLERTTTRIAGIAMILVGLALLADRLVQTLRV